MGNVIASLVVRKKFVVMMVVVEVAVVVQVKRVAVMEIA
jgi:hypothetical protein